MPVVAIANQKGGVGKTTTTAALAVLLSRGGQDVHVIDMDPQASLTSAFGQSDDEGLLYQAMTKRTALPVLPLSDHLTFTPSTIDLARGESEFMGEPGREFILQTCLEKTDLIKRETLVLLDCPPSLGVLALNCLAAADGLVVAVQPGGFELRALAHLEETVAVLRERINKRLKIIGAVLTNCNLRRLITDQVRQELQQHYGLLGVVRQDAQLLYATTEGRVLDLGPDRSQGLMDYQKVAANLQEALA